MSRVQLALNVDDIDRAVDFYSRLFGVEPHKRREGYANFAVDEPPLKLVLIENPGSGGTLNHLGIEVPSTDEVTAATRRLADDGMDTLVEEQTDCCFAIQDKVWVNDADGANWEIYTITDDAGVAAPGSSGTTATSADACGPACSTSPTESLADPVGR